MKCFHFLKWLVCSHQNLYIFQLIHFCQQAVCLVPAMVTVRAEINNKRFFIFGKAVF